MESFKEVLARVLVLIGLSLIAISAGVAMAFLGVYEYFYQLYKLMRLYIIFVLPLFSKL